MKTRYLIAVLICAGAASAAAQSMPPEALAFLDADGNVRVTSEEMIERMDLLFPGMDSNGNGQLEYPEVQAFTPRDVFDGADTDGNGVVSQTEFRLQVIRDFQAADLDGNGVLE
ncbi:MAG: EF-hand domain-containing protein [Pseudomonadota bacterium]